MFAFFPFCLAFGGVVVPKTYLILNILCSAHSDWPHNPSNQRNFQEIDSIQQCRDPSVQANVSRFQLYLNLITGLFAAITTPQFGSLSDRVGRKKVILLASFGGIVMEIITILVAKYPKSVSVNWLLLGALTDGLCGSFNTGMALAFAYASDCTPQERRNIAFGYFHGVLFTGIALGPVLAGYIIEQTGDHILCFYVAIGCHTFFMLFILTLVPESLSEECQKEARRSWAMQTQKSRCRSLTDRITTKYVLEPLKVLLPRRCGSSVVGYDLLLLAAIDTIMFGVAMSTTQIILIYAEFRFGWSELNSTIFLSITNIVRVAGLIILLPLLQAIVSRHLRHSSPDSAHRGPSAFEIAIIRVTTTLNLLGYVAYAYAPTSHVLVVAGMVIALGGMGPPSIQSAMTKSVTSNSTGRVLGAMGLLHAAARVVAPTVLNSIYSLTVSTYPGMIFLCLAGLFVAASVISFWLKAEGRSRFANETEHC